MRASCRRGLQCVYTSATLLRVVPSTPQASRIEAPSVNRWERPTSSVCRYSTDAGATSPPDAPVEVQPLVVAQAGPYEFKVTKGQKYSWCTCGRSAKQPICDGAHKGTGHKPLRMVADEDATLYLCGCKHTSTPPYCDGTHAKYA